jgi:hypothetical protein
LRPGSNSYSNSASVEAHGEALVRLFVVLYNLCLIGWSKFQRIDDSREWASYASDEKSELDLTWSAKLMTKMPRKLAQLSLSYVSNYVNSKLPPGYELHKLTLASLSLLKCLQHHSTYASKTTES